MCRNHLAIDLGAGSGRAIVGRITNDRKIELEELYRFTTQSVPCCGNLITNIYRIYEEILQSLKIYVQKYGRELGSVGVDTWATDFGILDKNGKLMGIPVFYRDSRTREIEPIVATALGYEQLHQLTGGRKAIDSTLHQLIAMVRQGDVSLQCGKTMLFLGDLLHYFLTGKDCSEYTVASYSQMYDVRKNNWEDEIFRIFNIPREIVPLIVYPGDELGYIRREIGDFVGLKQTPVIAPAVHDTASAVLAIPTAGGEDWAFISSGTWSLVGLELNDPIINHQSYLSDISNTGLAFGKILFKKNVMGLWIIQQCLNIWKNVRNDLGFPQIVQMAEQAKPFMGFIEPDDAFFFCPSDMTEAVVQYLKQTGQPEVNPQNIGQISRIVYESLAMKYQFALKRVKAVSGRKVGRIHVIGGGSNNEMLNQFTASATGLEVWAGPKEATSIGNIMLQAYGCGEVVSQEEIRLIVRESFPIIHYQPRDVNEWKTQYQRFINICALADM